MSVAAAKAILATCTESEFMQHSELCNGFCTSCAHWTCDGGVEPDAEGYACSMCGMPAGGEFGVVGAEQALLLGYLDIR